ncbi:MAG: ferredoxin [Hyphomicrobiales bacterium]
MRIEFQKEKCMRSGQCIYFHPKLFGEDPEGYPLVLVGDVPAELQDEAEDAADICPSGAIKLIPAQ